MDNATITRLSPYHRPWAWALRIERLDADVFDDFINLLKINVPSRLRKWDATEKRWLFQSECLGAVERLLQMHGITYGVEGEQSDTGRHRQLMDRTQAAAELYLLPNAPAEVVTAVYRTLCKVHHPDTGGDTAAMQRINAAMEVLRQ